MATCNNKRFAPCKNITIKCTFVMLPQEEHRHAQDNYHCSSFFVEAFIDLTYQGTVKNIVEATIIIIIYYVDNI